MSYTRSEYTKTVEDNLLTYSYHISQVDVDVENISVLKHVNDRLVLAYEQGLLGGKVNICIAGKPGGFKIKLHFPTTEILRTLAALLGNTSYGMSKLECDYNVHILSTMGASELLRLASKEVVIPLIKKKPTSRNGPTNQLESIRFGTKTDNHTFIMQVPNKKDLYGRTSLHTRFCLNGIYAIHKHVLRTLDELASFDWYNWHQSNVNFYVVNASRIGEIYCNTHNFQVPTAEECVDIFKGNIDKNLAPLHILYHEDEQYRAALRDHRLVVQPLD